MSSYRKTHYLLATSLILLLSGSNFSAAQMVNQAVLSGDIRLTLKHGLWKPLEEDRVYQDITMDLVCDRAKCDPEVWAFAPKFNQADHQGTVEIERPGHLWRLRVDMRISRDPWQPLEGEANYEIELRLHQNQLIGTYSGTFNNEPVKGEVKGTIHPHWPSQVANHLPIRPREHPRLIFRQQQLPAMRQKAKTPMGEAILAQLRKSLNQKIDYDGYVPTGGYHAAGHCLLSLLQEDKQKAETAWQITENSMKRPGPRLLEHSTIVAGVALAYDLCYNQWHEERIKQVSHWLAQETGLLIQGTPDRGWNPNPQSNWNARARGAAGLAALAILEEPDEFFQEPADAHRLLKIAERNVKRYLTMGIGDRGFGSEGDHYTTEPLFLTILPFLQAYENVLGQDLVQGSSAEWFLPHYVMRLVGKDGEVSVPTYGRHRLSPTGSLFAVGLGTVPERFLPGVMGFFNRHWGWDGDKTFGINLPHEAAFVLAGYPEDVIPQNPAEVLGRVLVDEQKGFYAFRNQWQDENDFVASIYLKQDIPKGGHWSFPDAGSFRIWGLGERWATAGSASNGKQEDENVVLAPEGQAGRGAKLTFFRESTDGSGVVTLQRYNWQRSFAVDYSGASGVPGLFVVVDKFAGEELEDKTWVMHTEGKVTVDGQGFTIQGVSGATMQGTFVTPQGVQVAFEKGEKGGVITATGGDRFFVVMTVQKGTAPKVEVLGTGLDATVKVGGQGVEFRGDQIVLTSTTLR